jgi:hypothetical protein
VRRKGDDLVSENRAFGLLVNRRVHYEELLWKAACPTPIRSSGLPA